MVLSKDLTAVTAVGFVGRQHYWVLDYLVTSTYRQQLSLRFPVLTEQKQWSSQNEIAVCNMGHHTAIHSQGCEIT